MKRNVMIGVLIAIVVAFVIWGISLQQQQQRLVLQQEVIVVASSDEQQVLGTLSKGTSLWLDKECDEQWCHVQWGDEAAKFKMPTKFSIDKEKERGKDSTPPTEQQLQIASDAKIYHEQSDDAKIIAVITANQEFPAFSVNDDWATVNMPNGIGYIQMDTTMTTVDKNLYDAVEAVQDTPLYQFDNLERRSQIGTLHAGEPVEVIDTTRYYYIIQFGNGEAFVAREHVQPTTNASVKELVLKSEATGTLMSDEPIVVHTQMDNDANVMAILEPNMRYVSVGQWREWSVIRIGGRVGYVQQQPSQDGIAVLHYEHVLPEEDVKKFPQTAHTIVTQQQFKAQMAFLAAEGYDTISKENLLSYIQGSYVLPQKAVLITFDGGLLSSKEYAYPILKERGFQAVQHVIAGRLTRAEGQQVFNAKKEQFLTTAEMKMLQDVFDMEAQTFNLVSLHDKLSILVQVNPDVVRDDFRQMVDTLGTVTSFAYPYGQYSEAVIDVLHQYGFMMGFTQQAADVTVNSSIMTLPRYTITQETTQEQFEKIVGQ